MEQGRRQELKSGKLVSNLLEAAVLARTGRRRREVLVRAGIGLDSTAIDLGGDLAVLSTDPITGAAGDVGYWAVHICCNDIAVFGAEPVALLLTVLLPEGATEEELTELSASAHRAALELDLEIAGGHTEITPAVRTTILSATAVGRVPRQRLITPDGARAGDLIVLTKGVGLEGTSILAETLTDRLVAAGVSGSVLERAKEMRWELSVVPAARIAREHRPTAMHDPTEGGVLGAAYEMAEAAGLGFAIRSADVPVRPETVELARVLGFDALRLISSGSLLCTVGAGAAAERLLAALGEAGIGAAVIGEMTPREAGLRTVRADGAVDEITAAPRDELWRLLHDKSK